MNHKVVVVSKQAALLNRVIHKDEKTTVEFVPVDLNENENPTDKNEGVLGHFWQLSKVDMAGVETIIELFIQSLLQKQTEYVLLIKGNNSYPSILNSYKGFLQSGTTIETTKDSNISKSLYTINDYEKLWCSELLYALKRLIRGLSTPQHEIGQRYVSTLALLIRSLSILNDAKVDLKILNDWANVFIFNNKDAIGNHKGELKFYYIGKLNYYMSLVKVLPSLFGNKREETELELLKIIKMIIIEDLEAKSYLKEGFGKVLLDLCKAMKNSTVLVRNEFWTEVSTMITNKYTDKVITGFVPIEILAIAIYIQSVCPDIQFFLPGLNNSSVILSKENLTGLANILKDSTYSHPRIHNIWSLIFDELLQLGREELLFEFWKVAVNDYLCDSHNHEKKYLSLLLFEYIHRLISKLGIYHHIKLKNFWSPSLMRIWSHSSLKKDNLLYKMSTYLMNSLVSIFGTNESPIELTVQIIWHLWSTKHLFPSFSALPKIEALIVGFNKEQLNSLWKEIKENYEQVESGQFKSKDEAGLIDFGVVLLRKAIGINEATLSREITCWIAEKVLSGHQSKLWSLLHTLLVTVKDSDKLVLSFDMILEKILQLVGNHHDAIKKYLKRIKKMDWSNKTNPLRLLAVSFMIECMMFEESETAQENLEDVMNILKNHGNKKEQNKGLKAMDVLCDLSLQCLSRLDSSNAYWKTLVMKLWMGLRVDAESSTLDLLIQPLINGIEEEDEEDKSKNVAENSSEEEDNEEEEGHDAKEREEEQSENKDANADMDTISYISEENPDYTDEQMAEYDDKLAAIFQAKKQQQQSLIESFHYRYKVLGLLELWTSKYDAAYTRQSWTLMTIIQPLLEFLDEESGSKLMNDWATHLRTWLLNKYLNVKAKELPILFGTEGTISMIKNLRTSDLTTLDESTLNTIVVGSIEHAFGLLLMVKAKFSSIHTTRVNQELWMDVMLYLTRSLLYSLESNEGGSLKAKILPLVESEIQELFSMYTLTKNILKANKWLLWVKKLPEWSPGILLTPLLKAFPGLSLHQYPPFLLLLLNLFQLYVPSPSDIGTAEALVTWQLGLFPCWLEEKKWKTATIKECLKTLAIYYKKSKTACLQLHSLQQIESLKTALESCSKEWKACKWDTLVNLANLLKTYYCYSE